MEIRKSLFEILLLEPEEELSNGEREESVFTKILGQTLVLSYNQKGKSKLELGRW